MISKIVLGNGARIGVIASQMPACRRGGKNDKHQNQTMKLLALLTLAATLVLMGCSKSEETTAPKTDTTNATPAAPK